MPWVRLDEEFPDHPKVVMAGPLAGWLHVCALAYCNRYLTDGFVAHAQVKRLADFEDILDMQDYVGQDAPDMPAIDPYRLAEKLVTFGMWERREGGFILHDYDKYQPTKAEVEAQRKVKSEAGKLGGQRSGQSRRSTSEAGSNQNGSTSEARGEAEPKHGASPPVPRLLPEGMNPDPGPFVTTSSSSNHLVAAPVENEEEDPRVQEALTIVVDRRLTARQGPPITNPPSWRRATLANARLDYADALRALCVNGTTPEAMADAVEPRQRAQGLAAVTSTLPERRWVEDDETGRGRWEDA